MNVISIQKTSAYMSELETKTPGPIVQRIKLGLMDAGITENAVRKEIMRITGVSKQNLTHWFNGTTQSPATHYIIDIAKAHSIDLIWLLLGQTKEEYWSGEEAITRNGKHVPVNIGHAENVHVHSPK